MIGLLRALTALPGPSGFERAPASYMLKAFRERGAEAEMDRMGNVIARVPGADASRKLMLCVHTDEVGLIVKHIADDGMVYFDPIGLVSPLGLPGAQVDCIVHLGETPGMRRGVIGTRSAHLAAGAPPPTLSDLWIDVGADRRATVEAMGIHIGTPITFRANFERLGDGYVMSKALDNRMGCALLLAALAAATYQPLPFDLYLAAVVQEEVGSRGAQVVARAVQPDWAITIDTVPAADPATPPQQTTAQLGGGPVLRSMDMMPNMMGTLYAPAVVEHLAELARTHNIAHQRDVARSWTDAATMEGVLRGGVFVPRRYAHSPTEVMKLADMEATLNLLVALITDPRTAERLGSGPWLT
ncbi:MAG: M20/M25/M40 family metallo-hydrolase [Anaerolineae bacterium]|nr:M20/M25/M40 family metallo-hydrolase [Anaerolineae bacterium]